MKLLSREMEIMTQGLLVLQTMGDDEDVVLAGSQLHQHLLDCGYTEAGHLETAQPSGGRLQGHEEKQRRWVTGQ